MADNSDKFREVGLQLNRTPMYSPTLRYASQALFATVGSVAPVVLGLYIAT